MSKNGGYYQDIRVVPTGFTPGAMSTGNGSGIDCRGYRTAILYANVVTGASKSYAIKMQSSSDNGVADSFADISGAACTAITANNTNAQVVVDLTQVERYLRAVITATSSPVAEQVWILKDPITKPATQDADETVVVHT